MPELPEVETVVRQLREHLSQRVLDDVRLYRRRVVRSGAAALERGLPGKRVAQVDRRGKRILIGLRPRACLVVHLGMTGQLLVSQIDAPLRPHTHLRVRLHRRHASRQCRVELRFRDPRRFGGLWYFDANARGAAPVLPPLGPEPLELSSQAFGALLRRRRQIKALLLDQRAIAGLGNIYCDEALHRAEIHPLRIAADLGTGEVTRLLRRLKSTLRAAIRLNGTTINDYLTANGREGRFARMLRVYGRAGQPCQRCGTPIERIVAAGRSSHICPNCQRR